MTLASLAYLPSGLADCWMTGFDGWTQPRAVVKFTSATLPLAALKAFIEPLASSYRPPFPVRLGIGVDAMTLGGSTIQSMHADIASGKDGWSIDTLEFRAPGATHSVGWLGSRQQGSPSNARVRGACGG